MNCVVMRWIALPAALLLLSGLHAVAHMRPVEPAVPGHGGFSAPLLPVPYPVKRPVDPGISVHKPIEDALRLTLEYRRLMDYFVICGETPKLLTRNLILMDNTNKLLRLLDEFEADTLQLNARFAASEQKSFDRRLLALRTELNHQILKVNRSLGIPLIRVAGAGLDCDVDTVEIKALAGRQVAMFVLLGEAPDSGNWEVRLCRETEEVCRTSIPATTNGLVPLSFDHLVGEIETNLSLAISYRPENPAENVMSLSVPLHIEAVKPALVEIECVDAETGESLPCRMQVKDRHDIVHAPLGARTTTVPKPWGGSNWNTHYRYIGEKFFYGKGLMRMTLPPGSVAVRALLGFEYEVYEQKHELISGETTRIRIPMKRWIDMHARGWRSGQTHMHNLGLLPVNDFSGWEIVPEAEGLDVSYLLMWKQNGALSTDQYPIGPITRHSHAGCIHAVGEEFRHFSRGHITLNGLQEIVEPISTGINEPEAPSNAEAMREARRQGALTAYAHFDSMGSFIRCEELPIDAALGLVDAGEVMGAGGGFTYWYALLNCGIRIGATAGPDWNLEDCCRVYVNMGGKEFNEKNWLDGLKHHRSFVTTGPMLFLTVNGQEPGSVISGDDARTLEVSAQALSAYPMDRLELVVNGEITATENAGEGEKTIVLETTYSPEGNGWIAARCKGGGHAHTSAVYIELNDEPNRAVEDAKLLRGCAMQALKKSERSGNYPSPEAKHEVLRIFREGIAFYDEIIERGGD